MGRKLDVDKLVGTAEIAARLGAKNPELIHDWRRRYKAGEVEHPFPKPAAELRIGMVWYWPDVERWAKATGRLK